MIPKSSETCSERHETQIYVIPCYLSSTGDSSSYCAGAVRGEVWQAEARRGCWPDALCGESRVASTMSRLMLGRTLERICKAVLLLCLVHFLIMMILYFDVYSQRFDIFSRFNNGRGANSSRGPHHYYNYSSGRPNTTFASYLPAADQLSPSAKSEGNRTHPTPKPILPCPEVPPGLGMGCSILLVLLGFGFCGTFIKGYDRMNLGTKGAVIFKLLVKRRCVPGTTSWKTELYTLEQIFPLVSSEGNPRLTDLIQTD